MVKIVIENLAQKEVFGGDTGKSVLHHIHAAGIDWMHACGGKGRCTSCKMIVLEGMKNLSAPSEAELRYRQQGLLHENERLACQSKAVGQVNIAVPEETKLAHLNYSN